MVLVSLFAALITVGAFIRIPVPVVPFTLQFLFTNLAGLLLGGRLGAAAVGVYITAGLAGLPVFIGGGGPGYFLQPTFGYIVGFCAGAWISGKIAEAGKNKGFWLMSYAGLAGLAAVYTLGLGYYWFIASCYLGSNIAVKTLFIYGFVFAVPGDIALCFIASAVACSLRLHIGR